MSQRVVLIPGDGIGPSICDAVVRIVEAAGADLQWETHHAGARLAETGADPLPPTLLDAIRSCRVALKGPLTTPVGKGYSSLNVRLRKQLDLYANLRPARSLPGVPSRYQEVDLIVVRENTEGLYSGIEHEVVPGVVESLKIMTRHACLRIARFAFEHARRHARRRVTAVHKANIMKLADGLFLDCFREVAGEYPAISADDCIVDAAAMKLVLDPHGFDVVVMENLYGDILSDLCAGLVGGLGVTAGANLGPECAVFEAVHGSAPDIAGRNLANPTALLQAGVMLLDHLGQGAVAARVHQALARTLVEGVRTRDLGGSASTTEFTEAVVARLEA
ncbi:MAG: NAD-dependent isocitrate dehydrogenase [Proteobacteria bacterium]|nr:NAD-dependent isocitrate dehydrogenase [Pseudomonadota bacterium]